nr:MAG: hypothetical protein J07AB56_13780 [Candidatus Nanosalinarum sp. J07AB56]
MRQNERVVAIDGGHAGKVGELQDVQFNGRRPDEARFSAGDKEFTTRLENLVATGGVDL